MKIPNQLNLGNIRLATILVAACFIASCGGYATVQNTGGNTAANQSNEADNTQQASPANDDLSALANLIKMPEIIPEDVLWRETESKSPSGKKLVAVFMLSEEDSGTLIASAEKNRAPENAELEPESWFPAELVAQSGLSGNKAIKGMSYAPNDFLNGAYNKGRVFHVTNTNYFILELTTY